MSPHRLTPGQAQSKAADRGTHQLTLHDLKAMIRA
ncbi:hypothetical protein ABH931_002699 [Streptacidiphilus sp. MAP12-33]